MGVWIGVGGVWKALPAVGQAIGVSSAWKTIAKMSIGVGGAWKDFFLQAVFDVPASALDVNAVGGGASCVVTFLSTGGYTCVGANVGPTASGNWITPTALAPGPYTIRAHINSGGPLTSGTLDTDLPLSTSRQWQLDCPGASSRTCDLLITIKDGSGNVMISQVCSMSVSSA